MKQTSQYYNPFPVVRDVDFRVSFSVMDKNAKKAQTVLKNSEGGVFSNPRATVNDVHETSGAYVALEKNLWRLDGSFNSLPENRENIETGYWSDSISDENGNFASPVVFRYTFNSPISTLGWTIYFDQRAKQYASRVRITAYNASGRVLDTGTYDNDSPVMMLQHYVGDYYSVQFEFLSTNEPLRRLRFVEVDFGLTKDYNRNTLGSARITYGADICAQSFPSRELEFTFDNADKRYNLLNPDGVYQYLQEGQLLSAKIAIGGETIPMGEFYFTRADVSNSAIVPKITAHDRVYSLDNHVFDGGRAEDIVFSAAVAEVLAGFDIPTRYEDGSASRMVSMTIPQNTKIREAVRMLAQAAMVSPYIDRDGVLVFADFAVAEEEAGQITSDELYDYTGVSIADPVQGVRLTVKDDFREGKDGTPGRQVTYSSGDQSASAVQKSFSNPCVADSAGQAVADWLLARSRMRKMYKVKNRCDPAVEIGDTLRIDDIFANRETAVVTGIEVEYDGALSAVTKGVGA